MMLKLSEEELRRLNDLLEDPPEATPTLQRCLAGIPPTDEDLATEVGLTMTQEDLTTGLATALDEGTVVLIKPSGGVIATLPRLAR